MSLQPAERRSGSKAASGAAKGTEKTAQGAKTLLERLKEFAVRHTHAPEGKIQGEIEKKLKNIIKKLVEDHFY